MNEISLGHLKNSIIKIEYLVYLFHGFFSPQFYTNCKKKGKNTADFDVNRFTSTKKQCRCNFIIDLQHTSNYSIDLHHGFNFKSPTASGLHSE